MNHPAFAPAATDSAIAAVMPITPRPADVVMVRGEGSWLWDAAGRRYLDFMQGWAVNTLGHAHPALCAALSAQASRLLNPSPAFYNDQALRLSHSLAQASGLDKVFLCSTGAEANEGAIKLARKWGRRYRGGAWKIITFTNGFHGRSLATMSATGKPGWDEMFAPQVAGFPKACFNDIDSVAALVDAEVVAVMLEPIQGEAGVIPATQAFMQALQALCQQHGLLLICDEVQTGIGRTGPLFAFEALGVRPDILTLAKGLGGGVPLAALLCSAAVSCFDYGEQGGTFAGNPLCAALGNAVLDAVCAPGFLAQVVARGEQLKAGLQGLAQRHELGEWRGAGLLQALELGPQRDAASLVTRLREAGLLLNAPRPHCLRFMPALNVSRDEIEQMLALLDAALA